MPRETFLNLSKEKQKNLLDAAILEFSEHDYHEASINQIINRAGIPRGSFYMYFKDKEDLYNYIINQYIKQFEEETVTLLKGTNGDFIQMCEMLYNKIIAFCNTNVHKKLLNNFFSEMRFSTEKKLLFKPTKEEFEVRKKFVLSLINKDLYNTQCEDELFDAFLFAMFTTVSSIAHYFIDKTDYPLEKEIYLNRLHIIKYGICGKEEKYENNN